MSTFVVVITQEAVQGFIRPALDLQTGQLVELEPIPEQLELFDADEQGRLLPERQAGER